MLGSKFIQSSRLFSQCQRCICSSLAKYAQIPKEPTWQPIDLEKYKFDDVDSELVEHLERLALVDFGNQEGVDRLRDAVHFANQLLDVDTTGIEPMDTVLEHIPLYIREDKVTEGNQRDDILKNASKTVEEYFVAPPGNIPLNKGDQDYS